MWAMFMHSNVRLVLWDRVASMLAPTTGSDQFQGMPIHFIAWLYRYRTGRISSMKTPVGDPDCRLHEMYKRRSMQFPTLIENIPDPGVLLESNQPIPRCRSIPPTLRSAMSLSFVHEKKIVKMGYNRRSETRLLAET
jgi:hypothetical protein